MIRNIPRALAIAMIVGGLSTPSSASQQIRPTLKLEVAVASDLVRIGDLIDNAGTAADVPVFRAPDLGQTGTVQVSRIVEAVKQHHLVNLDTQGMSEVAVTRKSRVISLAELEAHIIGVVAERTGIGEAKNLTVTFDRDARPAHVEPLAVGALKIARAAFEPSSGRFDVTFELPGSAAAQRQKLRYTGHAIETVPVAILVRSLARGDVIKPQDITIERRPKINFNIRAAENIEQVVGLAARQPLRPGQPLRPSDLMKPEVIKANETITVVYEVPGLVLSVRGKALEAGALNDTINIMNSQSKRTLQGTVAGPGRVSVAPATPHAIQAQAGTTTSITAAIVSPRTE